MAQMVDTFWTADRILLAVAFILGLLIGGFVTYKYIGPFLNGPAQDTNSLSELNTRLVARNGELYRCLLSNNVPPSACNPGSFVQDQNAPAPAAN